ncbi:DUF6480 family protein [Streptomyces fuscigenes]|uniref:DUF6480 family protein n=1 Tax=Streptomyces fuscigenes TaxID=1528880 RepID=UPI001F407091|nr:DUF6480 family protein [Streptomyces fuscigenes]MCF3964944.1 DUF6480 family protein [Streptomyces fuscigenes]
MIATNQDPDPLTTAGLEPGGGVPPGETPPAEGSTSEAGPLQETSRGWAGTPLTLIVLLAVAVAGFFLAYAVVVNAQ